MQSDHDSSDIDEEEVKSEISQVQSPPLKERLRHSKKTEIKKPVQPQSELQDNGMDSVIKKMKAQASLTNALVLQMPILHGKKEFQAWVNQLKSILKKGECGSGVLNLDSEDISEIENTENDNFFKVIMYDVMVKTLHHDRQWLANDGVINMHDAPALFARIKEFFIKTSMLSTNCLSKNSQRCL